ncbi:Glycerol-3-phosphate dehydrogenase sdp6, mitochondrial [Turnera subulata]|uniref:Glycerol-3-phosphate dehydrogenase sdp6, mitochondrial n=1 Tax=Turnera subulata TaxID=218843 RepID=A0A9Q0G614_9ROSI|nr:Glycerol-3-phosphate dehydrogenase sdp6, mitochondrial [Turnera subulata]
MRETASQKRVYQAVAKPILVSSSCAPVFPRCNLLTVLYVHIVFDFSMAEDAVDAVIKSGKLTPANWSLAHNLRLLGADGWEPSPFTVFAQKYVRMKRTYGGKVVPGVMDTATAKHLCIWYES